MRTVARTAFLMIILTFVSKCFGFIRELLLANYYGAGYIIDAYVMATVIPGIIFGGIFASISTAYMPTFSKKIESEGLEAANKFTSEVMNLALVISIVAGLIGIIFSEQIVSIFAGGFQGETAELTSFYVKITFSYVIFSSTMSLMESYLQYKGVFLPQVLIGYVQNTCIITIIIVSAYTTHYIIVLGWLLGYAARMLTMFHLARKKGYEYKRILNFNETVKNIIILAVPVFIGSSINQINMFVDKTLASGLPEGSVAALNYAGTLITMISGLTVSILITISYPKLAQASSLNDNERFGEILSTGINLIAIIAIPCSLGAIIYNELTVQIIYERGAFDVTATAMTSSALLYYAIGLFFTSVISLLTQAFYSKHNMRTPMIFAAIGAIINITLNLILIRPMAHNGLALATSIAAIVTMILLSISFKRFYPEIRLIRSLKKLFFIIISGIVSVGASWAVYLSLSSWIDVNKIVMFGLVILFAGLLYLALLAILKVEELKLLKQIIKRR